MLDGELRLRRIENTERRIIAIFTAAPLRAAESLYQDTDVTVLDAHDASVLACSHLPLELAFAKARARGLSVLKIRRCRQRQLIMGYLARLASRGMNVTAFWRNSQLPLTEQVVGFRANSSVPSIRIYAVSEVPEENKENTGITVVMANPRRPYCRPCGLITNTTCWPVTMNSTYSTYDRKPRPWELTSMTPCGINSKNLQN